MFARQGADAGALHSPHRLQHLGGRQCAWLVLPLAEERAQSRVHEKAQIVAFWHASRLLKPRRFPLPTPIEVEDESSGKPGTQRGRNARP